MTDFPILGLSEFKGYSAIYLPTLGVIKQACSCGKDVHTDCGFVYTAKKEYVCSQCIKIVIGGNKASDLLMYSQEKYRKSLK